MAKKSEAKSKQIVVENPPPPTKPRNDEVNFIGNELADVSERVNELQLCIEDMRKDLERVMGRMGL